MACWCGHGKGVHVPSLCVRCAIDYRTALLAKHPHKPIDVRLGGKASHVSRWDAVL